MRLTKTVCFFPIRVHDATTMTYFQQIVVQTDAFAPSPEILHILSLIAGDFRSVYNRGSIRGVSQCNVSRPSKQKLGAVALLAWDRSGGSIKIFLDAGGTLRLLFFSWSSTRSAVYKKKKKDKKKKQTLPLGWTKRKWF